MIDNIQQLLQEIGERLDAGDRNQVRRLFHGRGQCYPKFDFLTVDWFSPVLLFVLYRKPEEVELDEFIASVDEWFINGVEGVVSVVVQHRWAKPVESIVLGNDIPNPHHVQEDGLNYQVRLTSNQNSGFFIDASDVRRWVREHAEGKSVLNLFSYTCSFSVVALAGGADKVVNIDMSKGALNTGKVNHALNGISENAIFLGHNIFKSWGKLRKMGSYDLIIVDPPSYQPGSFVAQKDYSKVVARLSSLLAPGGKVVSVLNSPQAGYEFLRDVYRDHAPSLQECEVLSSPDSFEEVDAEMGLKVIVFKNSA